MPMTEEQREKHRIRAREWRRKNPEKAREYIRRYYERHPEARQKWREYLRDYMKRARIKKRAMIIERLGGKCRECGSAENLVIRTSNEEIKAKAKRYGYSGISYYNAILRVLDVHPEQFWLVCRSCMRR